MSKRCKVKNDGEIISGNIRLIKGLNEKVWVFLNNWQQIQGLICAAWNAFAHVIQSSVGLHGSNLPCCDISTAGRSNRCARLQES